MKFQADVSFSCSVPKAKVPKIIVDFGFGFFFWFCFLKVEAS